MLTIKKNMFGWIDKYKNIKINLSLRFELCPGSTPKLSFKIMIIIIFILTCLCWIILELRVFYNNLLGIINNKYSILSLETSFLYLLFWKYRNSLCNFSLFPPLFSPLCLRPPPFLPPSFHHRLHYQRLPELFTNWPPSNRRGSLSFLIPAFLSPLQTFFFFLYQPNPATIPWFDASWATDRTTSSRPRLPR